MQIAADIGTDLDDAFLEEAASAGEEVNGIARSGSRSECAIVV